MKTVGLILSLAIIAGGIFYTMQSNNKISKKEALILENIEALTSVETPVHIPCIGQENEWCKFLTLGSDSVLRHVEIQNMKHE